MLVIVITVYEVMSGWGPKEFDSPITQFLRLSGRDKVVLFVAFSALMIIFWLGMGFRSRWINLLFLGLGFLAFRLIGSFFGSRELMEKTAKDRDQPQS